MLGCDWVLTTIFVLSTFSWGRAYHYYLRQLKTQPVITLKLLSDSCLRNDRKYNVPSKLKSLKKGKSNYFWMGTNSKWTMPRVSCHSNSTNLYPCRTVRLCIWRSLPGKRQHGLQAFGRADSPLVTNYGWNHRDFLSYSSYCHLLHACLLAFTYSISKHLD